MCKFEKSTRYTYQDGNSNSILRVLLFNVRPQQLCQLQHTWLRHAEHRHPSTVVILSEKETGKPSCGTWLHPESDVLIKESVQSTESVSVEGIMKEGLTVRYVTLLAKHNRCDGVL